jgi:hypothetical protein
LEWEDALSSASSTQRHRLTGYKTFLLNCNCGMTKMRPRCNRLPRLTVLFSPPFLIPPPKKKKLHLSVQHNIIKRSVIVRKLKWVPERKPILPSRASHRETPAFVFLLQPLKNIISTSHILLYLLRKQLAKWSEIICKSLKVADFEHSQNFMVPED